MQDSHFVDRFGKWNVEIARITGVDEKLVRYVVDTHYDFIVEAMSNPTMPAIKLGKLGKFTPSNSRINASLRASFRHFHRGNKTREEMTASVRKLWPVKQRLYFETLGGWTAQVWHRLFRASKGETEIDFRGENEGSLNLTVPDHYRIYSGGAAKPNE